MKLIHLPILVMATSLFACSTGPTPESEPAPPAPVAAPAEPLPTDSPERAVAGKPEAPVDISVAFEPNASGDTITAHVRLAFSAAGEAVRVRAYGVRGADVKGEGVLAESARVALDQSLVFDVPFAARDDGAMFVVQVHGSFAVGERASVRAFPIATTQPKVPTTRAAGERLRVMPADEQQH